MKTRREIILSVVEDLVADFMFYDRKEDADLPRGAIEEAVEAGEVTYDEIIEVFAKELKA
jgi:hypothetical protein